MSTKNGNTISWRVDQLEKQAECLDVKIDSILQNHLPHIQNEVSELKTRISILSAINIGAIILALLINRFL